MNARELFDAGRLNDAVQALNAEVRDDPTDVRRRTFLFELLCFAGLYDRAGKQLDVLAEHSKAAATGALLYRAALHAERTRQEMFESGGYWRQQQDAPESPEISGMLNGKPFSEISDADIRIGRRLEVF